MATDLQIPPAFPTQQIDLTSAAPIAKLETEVQRDGALLSGLQKAGVGLANKLIGVICLALIVLTLLVAGSEIWPSSDVTELHSIVLQVHAKAAALPASSAELPELRKDVQEMSRQIADAKQAQRAFWMQFSQMILLNLLLPVLTAILGYVFGASSTTNSESK